MTGNRELLELALEALELERWPLGTHRPMLKTSEVIDALRERLEQLKFDSALQSAAMTQTAPKLAQPEQTVTSDHSNSHQPEQWEQFYPDMGKPLDRMAENARELGLDYEPAALKVHYGEVCYKSKEDDQSYGMWVPVTPNNRTPFAEGTEFFTTPHANTKVNFEGIPKQVSEPVQEPVAWTPVSAAMPKPGVTVLACYKNSHDNVRRIRAKWVPAKTQEAHGDDEWGEYDEEADTYWTPEGWYECIDNWGEYSSVFVGEGEVTHWMPMPPDPYTTPPRREWQGLTEDEMRDLEKQFNAERVRTSDEEYLVIYPGDYWAWQRAIEAKLREKNA